MALSQAQREEIVELHRSRTSIGEIARRTGRDRGTVRRILRALQTPDAASPEEVDLVSRTVELLQFSPALRRRFRQQLLNALELDDT